MADAVPATKACDNCRIKKVRCDRNQPCLNCQQRGIACTKSPRVARPRRHRQLDSAPYLSRIRHLERQLEHARSVNSHISEQSPGPQRHDPDLSEDGSPSNSVVSSAASLDQESTVPPHGVRIRISSPPSPDIAHSESDNLLVRPADENEPSLVMVEGPTSLSAHSKMAIGFLDRVAVVDRERGYNFDTRELLDDLDHIVQAIKAPQAMLNCYPDIGVQ